MKKGIHLGPPLSARSPSRSAVLAVLTIIGVGLGVGTYRALRDVVRLRQEVAETAAKHPGDGESGDEVESRAALRLRALLASGLPASVAPTEVLASVTALLPDGVVVESLSMKVSPPNERLLIEAVANEAGEVTELERRMARAPLVSATRLLEERRSVEGGLRIRLEVDLTGERP